MAKETIVAVEDDENILELITFNVEREGHRVAGFVNGEDALRYLRLQGAGCVLLDIMLPGMDGLEVCRKIRATPEIRHLPIIMLTAKGGETEIVAGLEVGADDYIVKPFSPRVLVARIRAVLRRKREKEMTEAAPISLKGIEIVPGCREVTVDGAPVTLTQSEFKALYLLAGRPGWVFTRYQIVEYVHGPDYPVTDRSVDVLMVGLRKKMGARGQLIETVRGTGYRFIR